MDEITAILDMSRPVEKIISDLKVKSVDVPLWKDLQKNYDPEQHNIVTDKTSRPDKTRSDGTLEKAALIYVALEQLAVKRMTEFMFAIPVKRVYGNVNNDPTKQEIVKAIESIYKYARINTENIERSKAYFASCEMCTLWYSVKKPNTLYGFKSEYKLKCKTYSPMDGYKLYPLFDEFDDMLAMSFEYNKSIKDEDVLFFETFTENRHIKWKMGSAEWEIVEDEEIKLGKIPLVYAHRDYPIYNHLSHIRSEIEFTLSRNSDVIAYNSAPILKVTGEIKGDENKGESRRVYRTEKGGDVDYVSWQQAIEALKYHIDTLLRIYFMQLQLPDISFDNVKTLGNIGFDARQTLLADAHLKVGDEKGAFFEFFEREASVIKSFLKQMNKQWSSLIDDIDIEHVITPFIQNDEKAEIEKRIIANGGKAVESQLESIERSGLSDDPQETLKQIQAEEKESAQSRVSNILETAV